MLGWIQIKLMFLSKWGSTQSNLVVDQNKKNIVSVHQSNITSFFQPIWPIYGDGFVKSWPADVLELVQVGLCIQLSILDIIQVHPKLINWHL